jgi:hypothetical protein
MGLVCYEVEDILLETMFSTMSKLHVVLIEELQRSQHQHLRKEDWNLSTLVQIQHFVDCQPFMLSEFVLVQLHYVIDGIKITKIEVKLCVVRWIVANWAAEPAIAKHLIYRRINIHVLAELDKIAFVFLQIHLSQSSL